MAADAKEKVLDALDDLKETGRSLAEDFKQQTPFFKARVGVIAGWLTIVALSILFIPPTPERNALGAKIKVGSIAFGSREKTFIEVKNDSRERWEEARVTISGTSMRNGVPVKGAWLTSERWRPGETKTLLPEMFKDRDGLKPELDVKVDVVSITVDAVTVTRDLNAVKPR